jgi:phthiodiolone/phenolphthiodiolone dimycocerosates ketoreductase
VARFEEAMATIRALWNSGGELVNRDSEFFPLRNAIFDLPAYRGKWPEIWVGAHGPRMLRATGRYADAYFPGFPHTPAEYAQRLDVVRSAASDAGRDPMAITPAVWLPAVVCRTDDDLDEALESEVLRAGMLNASDAYFAQHGAQHPLGGGFAGAQDLLPQDWDEQTALALIETVPKEVARNAALCGRPEEVVERAAVWRDHGVRHLVIADFTGMQRNLRKGITAKPLVARVLRSLRRL